MDPLKLLSRPSRMTRLFVVLFSCVLIVLLLNQAEVVPLRLWEGKSPILSTASSPDEGSSSGMANSNSTSVHLGWYPPSQTLINNLTNVVSDNTKGVYGFIYNSSHTPDAAYGTYNWCNMPHVRGSEYKVPSDEYELVYVELVSRT